MKPTPERRKLATVLFCDLAGSTSLGERLDPEAVRMLQSRLFGALRGVIESHGGTVEKYVGDAVMAVFGIPVAHEDDALRAVRAASEIHDAVAALDRETEASLGASLVVRIGINTGEVVAGDATLRQHLVSGDAVNVAARLEQSAAAGETLIGPLTRRLTERVVAANPAGPLSLKGKSEAIEVFRVTGVPLQPGHSRPANVRMIGRKVELAALLGGLDDVVKRCSSRLVTVVGEAGIGKSRLVAEFERRTAARAHVFRGRCLPYGQGITYWPIREIVREAAGVSDADAADLATKRIEALLDGADQAELAAVRVGQAIGLRGGAASADEVAWAIRQFLHALARTQPAVVVFDDLQWAESALLDLISGLTELVEGVPLLVLGLTRADLLEQRADWPVDIRLGPLEASALAELLAQRLGGAPDEALIRHVAGVSGGNPLFLEELASALAEEDLIRTDGETLRLAGPVQRMALPASLSMLLSARLDRLETAEREMVEFAAVEGERFHADAIRAMRPRIGLNAVTSRLDALEASDLIRPAAPEIGKGRAYAFRHLLLRDAAYASIPKRRRADLHLAFADWLEAAGGAQPGQYLGVLGYHLETAYRALVDVGERAARTAPIGTRAAHCLSEAGRRSFARGEMASAAALLGRALNLTPEGSDRPAIQHDLGAALGYTGELEVGRQHLADAVRSASELGLSAQSMKSRLLLVSFKRKTDPEGADTAALELGVRAIPVFEAAADHGGLMAAWGAIAVSHFDQGNTGAAVAALERALHESRDGSDPLRRSALFGTLLLSMCCGSATVDETVRRCRAILSEARRQGPEVVSLLMLRGDVFPLQAWAEAMRGRFATARKLCLIAREGYRQLGSAWDLVGWLPLFSSRVEILAGAPHAAEHELRAGLMELERMGVKSQAASEMHLLAQALYAQDRFDEALDVTQQTEDIAASDDLEPQLGWRAVRAKILARRGEAEEATRLIDEAVALVDRTDWALYRADILIDRAKTVRRLGLSVEAGNAAAEAAEMYARKGVTIGLRHARSLLKFRISSADTGPADQAEWSRDPSRRARPRPRGVRP